MKKVLASLATSLACCALSVGTGIAQNTPTIITPAANPIAPNGIGVTPNELLFSQPFCQTGGQARGVYTATGLVQNGAVWNATIGLDFALPEINPTCSNNAGAENYFFISPGLGGFPANSVYATAPISATADAVYKDGALFINNIADSNPGHAGITFDTVGTFNFDLIVTTPSAVTGYTSAGTLDFTIPAPANTFLETATVAPATNTACPGCLYVTSTNQTTNGTIYSVLPGGTTFTAVATTRGIEPEGILFVPPNACVLGNTNFAYFVSAYAAGPDLDTPKGTTTGALLAYTLAQISPLAGKALIPYEGGKSVAGSIDSFDPSTNTFASFSTPVPIPATTPSQYQLEGASMTACPIPPTSVDGRMTGGGSFFTPDGTRVTHGLELHCTVPSHPNTLEVNWGGGNNFHLDNLTSVTCTLDPAINQGHPAADFNTMVGTGTGTLNGLPATINFEFTDAGEPGTSDQASITIHSGSTTFTVPLTVLDKGNQQAHKN